MSGMRRVDKRATKQVQAIRDDRRARVERVVLDAREQRSQVAREKILIKRAALSRLLNDLHLVAGGSQRLRVFVQRPFDPTVAGGRDRLDARSH